MSTITASPITARQISVEARPGPLVIDPRQTAVLVVDAQNDFAAEGGMFHRAGIDISPIQATVKPINRVIQAARKDGLYKHRFSGFYQTELDTVLKQQGIRYLIVTGCTTSVCVESTVRDAMFRDYSCLVLEDCCAEPIGYQFSRSNHEASLLVLQLLFGWVSSSNAFIHALSAV